MKKIFIFLHFFITVLFLASASIFAKEKENVDNYSTEELLEEVINSNIFNDLKLFSNDYTAINSVIDNFVLGKEFINRNDADKILFNKYISMYEKCNGIYFKDITEEIYKVELLLMIPNCTDDLTSSQKEILRKKLMDSGSNNNSSRSNNNIIYTPNGSLVDYVATNDEVMTDVQKLDCHNEVKGTYGLTDSDLISEATPAYNCHSYAWYSQVYSTNTIWISYPDSYIEDYSYEATTLVKENYILCYISRGIYYTDSIIPKYGEYISHSALITDVGRGFDVTNLNTLGELEVKSKWGSYGLYNHFADNCPYVEEQYGFVRVEIYRPRFHISTEIDNNFSNATYGKMIDSNDNLNSYFLMEINSSCSNFFDIEIDSSESISIKFLDSNMHSFNVSPVEQSISNKKYIKKINEATFYIRVEFENVSSSGGVYIIIGEHSLHKYEYKAINNNFHILTCPCGVTSGSQSLHIADNNSSIGGKRVCVLCGRLLPSTGSGNFPLN